MKISFKMIAILATLIYSHLWANWTVLDVPMATSHAYFQGLSGNSVVGVYEDNTGFHGFLYDIETNTWSTVDNPGANLTNIEGVDGDNLVGHYIDDTGCHGFIHNTITKDWIMIDKPDTGWTNVNDMSGNVIVGTYQDNISVYGYSYDLSEWSTIVVPEYNPPSESMHITGIDGINIVGWTSMENHQGFLYNGTSWTFLEVAGAISTYIRDIDGPRIVGTYIDSHGIHGFVYNYISTEWTFLNKPGATITRVNAIEGDVILGEFEDLSGKHGFLYTVPEPCSMLLLGLGCLIIHRRQ